MNPTSAPVHAKKARTLGAPVWLAAMAVVLDMTFSLSSAWAQGQVPPSYPLPGPAFPQQTEAPASITTFGYQVQTVSWGLVKPFSLAFLPDGDFLVTERPGRMRIVSPAGAISAPVAGFPDMANANLLDVVLDPKFSTNRLIYFSFSEVRGDGNGLSVARARLSDDGRRLEDLRIILRTGPSRALKLASSRLVFARDGTLFVTNASTSAARGAAKGIADAQSLSDDGGKILRINPDGTIPRDNPFMGRPGALAEIYTLGHRDIQGAALNPQTGGLWAIEHGPQGGDELNAIRPGLNYGWPIISYGSEYDGTKVGDGKAAAPGLEQPVYFWRPSIAPSGLLFYSGDLFPEWKGSLFVGALKGKHLSRLVLKDDRVVGEEELLSDLESRIRDIRQGPDGAIYLLTDEDAGRIIKITPKGR